METRKETAPYKTRLNINENTKEQIIALLHQQMADNFDLYSQTKQAHWNVKGLQFQHLHEFFDALAKSIERFTDILAERITALGGIAKGTVRMAASQSTIPEIA